MGLDSDCEGSGLHSTFCLIEVRAMVVAAQLPIAECTAIFSVSIANHRPLLVQDMLTLIIGPGNHKYLVQHVVYIAAIMTIIWD